MTEKEKRAHRVCFAGHRPEKLFRSEWSIKEDLEFEIRKEVVNGRNVFISGMAPGVDIWAAEIVLKLRDNGMDMKLICAVPFQGFEKRWPEWEQRFDEIIRRADLVRFICPCYSRGCHQVRNEWMINHSAKMIAVFNGRASGTKNAINYANRVGIPVVYVSAG